MANEKPEMSQDEKLMKEVYGVASKIAEALYEDLQHVLRRARCEASVG